MPRRRGRPSKKQIAEREGRVNELASSGHGHGKSHQKKGRSNDMGRDELFDKKEDFDGDQEEKDRDEDEDGLKDGQDAKDDGLPRKNLVTFEEYLTVSKFQVAFLTNFTIISQKLGPE